jgi:hypothetical protein
MPKGNPNPIQPEAFFAQQQPKYSDTALGGALSVRFYADDDAALRAMSDRQNFIRDAVAEKLHRETYSRKQLEHGIQRVLMAIPPRDRAAANRLFKKLVAQLELHS